MQLLVYLKPYTNPVNSQSFFEINKFKKNLLFIQLIHQNKMITQLSHWSPEIKQSCYFSEQLSS